MEVAVMAFEIETSLFSRHPRKQLFSTLLSAGIAAALLTTSGCSISTSISDSVSSPFKWSSKSSSEDKEEAYQGDIRDYTEAYLRTSSDIEAFRKGLASLAAKHGITNWEADQATYIGIGEGLGKAKVSNIQLETYMTNLSGGDVVKATAIQKGFEKSQKEKKS